MDGISFTIHVSLSEEWCYEKLSETIERFWERLCSDIKKVVRIIVGGEGVVAAAIRVNERLIGVRLWVFFGA